jgi:8-oxo-dGTP pyrophosphatase MutT (NUDIX family)
MEVPAEVAKMVIGSGGAAIRELQERTGAHVLIFKPKPGAVDNGPRPVMIKGSRYAVDAAASELRKAVRDYEYGDRGGGQGGYGGQPSGGGASYGGSGGDRGGDHRGSGDPRDSHMSEARGRGGYGDGGSRGGGGGGGGARGDADEIIEDSYECPIDAVGMVIGKGGARVKRLEEETGCRVVHDREASHLILKVGSRV